MDEFIIPRVFNYEIYRELMKVLAAGNGEVFFAKEVMIKLNVSGYRCSVR